MREVIARHPTTGEIFIQLGRMFRALPGHLYASYDPPMSVEDFAKLNGLDVGPLLETLNAAAEAEAFPARFRAGTGAEPRRERPDEGPDAVPYTETLYGEGRIVGPAD